MLHVKLLAEVGMPSTCVADLGATDHESDFVVALGLRLADLHGCDARQVVPRLKRGVEHMAANPQVYEGGARDYLRRLLAECETHPSAVVAVA